MIAIVTFLGMSIIVKGGFDAVLAKGMKTRQEDGRTESGEAEWT